MDTVEPLRILLAFGIVIGMIGLGAFFLRWLLNKNPALRMGASGGRLQIVESKMIDARRKLVIVRRDDKEHLLLLSPQGDIVVENVESAPHV